MKVEIIQFEPGHLDQMDMREFESSLDVCGDALLEASVESKTVCVDDTVLCSYGIFANNGLWQIPSIHIGTIPVKYARATIKTLRDMIRGKTGVHTYCLDDEFHKRWMGFLGFKRNPDRGHEYEGHKIILYEVNHGR